MTTEERRECFKNWALAKAGAEGIKEKTALGYVSALNRIWSESTVTDKKHSPYEYGKDNTEDFKDLKRAFENNGDFKDYDGKCGYEWYLEFLTVLKDQPFDDDLVKFRNLLRWFVWQIRVDHKILQGEPCQGKGYNGDKIINCYKDWREYNGFTLDCTISPYYRPAYYIHLSDKWVNIEPEFTESDDKKDVSALRIAIKQSGNKRVRTYPPFNIKDLAVDTNDYSGDYCPDYLKDLFALFKEEIKFYKMSDNTPNRNKNMKEHPKNLILYGPPGTGKTYNTAKRAVEIIDGVTYPDDYPYKDIKDKYDKYYNDGRIQFVTFHQSYGYEDFIEGIKPSTEDGQIMYKLTPGIFKKFCGNARGKNLPYVFIIDEINRGNISKIFGELITLIEDTKREGKDKAEQTKVTLPSGEEFSVPSNVYIIGTMNTADRSVAAIDTALRRRFYFEEMMPDTGKLDGTIVEGIDIAAMLDKINRRIEVLYDREHTIGHAYFIKLKEKPTLGELAEIFKMKVIPLLQEYFYEDYEKIRLVLGDTKGDEAYQFVVCTKIDQNDLFDGGSTIELDAEYTYSINYEALKEAQSYIKIYQTDSKAE